jgi:hypothetical protein
VRQESGLSLRDAAAQESFPYRDPTVCFIEVHADGAVTQGADEESVIRAKRGASRLFAVWPGQWSSDLFTVDPDEFAKGRGDVHDPVRTGLQEHFHDVEWELDPYRDANPRSPSTPIRVRFRCGCEMHDIQAFAKQMREQRGWDVRTSVGWGGSGGSYSVTVRRGTVGAPISPPSAAGRGAPGYTASPLR